MTIQYINCTATLISLLLLLTQCRQQGVQTQKLLAPPTTAGADLPFVSSGLSALHFKSSVFSDRGEGCREP